MKHEEYAHLLVVMPCIIAQNWLETQPDMEIAWNNCPRGDWLLWCVLKLRPPYALPPKEVFVRYSQWCAKRARKHAAAYASAAAYAAANAAAADAAAYASAADAAYASADAAAAHAAYETEYRLQARYLRRLIKNPFDKMAVKTVP